MVSDEEIAEEITKATVKNAINYGKARESTVLNSILSKFPEMRPKIKDLSKKISAEVARINSLSPEEIKTEGLKYNEEFASERKEKIEKTSKPKMVLEGAENGTFVTRFPPAPNGYMHIGHAKAVFMEKEFSRIYNGKINLYFDDTNPETDRQEYVESFKKDLEWLNISFDAEYYASDNIEKMYSFASDLIKKGKAYVCDCPSEEISEKRSKGIDCTHKEKPIEKNLSGWEKMLSDKNYPAILRYKGDIKDQNTALRDPTLFRVKQNAHYRQGAKYWVWPTYDFNTPIMDSMMGVTDVLRSKEYELRDRLYYEILVGLGLRLPRLHSFARLEINDNITSKRKLKELISKNLLWGFNDPRLVTIAGLRRRGIQPKAIMEFVLRFGMSKTDSKVGIEMLLAENRKLIDNKSPRLFFIKDPIKITITGIPDAKRKIEMKSHPSESLKHRRYNLSDIFFINSYDALNLRNGDTIKLKDSFSIKICNIGKDNIEANYLSEIAEDAAKIPWVNQDNYLEADLFEIGNLLENEKFNEKSMLSTKGFIESYAGGIEEGGTVQLERIGFFKLDSKEKMAFIGI